MKQKKILEHEQLILADKIKNLQIKDRALNDIIPVIESFHGKSINGRLVTALENLGFSVWGEKKTNSAGTFYQIHIRGNGLTDSIYMDLQQEKFDFKAFSASNMWFNRVDQDLEEWRNAEKELPAAVELFNNTLEVLEKIEAEFHEKLNYRF